MAVRKKKTTRKKRVSGAKTSTKLTPYMKEKNKVKKAAKDYKADKITLNEFMQIQAKFAEYKCSIGK